MFTQVEQEMIANIAIFYSIFYHWDNVGKRNCPFSSLRLNSLFEIQIFKNKSKSKQISKLTFRKSKINQDQNLLSKLTFLNSNF